MQRPICVGCKTEFRPEENGVYVLQVTKDGPYKVWHADLWQCPICGHQMIEGFGRRALKTRHEEDFESYREQCDFEFQS